MTAGIGFKALKLNRSAFPLFFSALIKYVYGTTYMRNRDRTTNYQHHVQSLEKFLVRNTLLDTTDNMIGNTIIAAQHCGSNQAQQLFRFHVQSTLLVSSRVQREKPLDPEVASRKNAGVHAFAIALELFKIVQ